ncbi:DUF4123 domain-containing protein [Vibrio nitrifigilis]|uniref:DUF4123 domain-containing protein n=1 Tax=Vibrio nitrifigilis TaxID=2789781 RepID=A0ABS0GMP3_9VIBR|nr:DUF4123 domain-containing protein [Vibrio nitrifigilis]MBF9003443.1 DUF4123 domain-containing protein [Vibrio nitrifigilis]
MSLFSSVKAPQGQQWMVVDKIRVPDIEELAYRYLPDLELTQLFLGTPYEHLNEIGPVAFKYTAVKEFEMLLSKENDIRTSSVLFSVAEEKDQEMLIQHLQALHYVIVDDSPMFFRFYSVPTWDGLTIDQLTENDINTVLGPFDSLSWIGEGLIVNTIKRKLNNKNKEMKFPYKLTSEIFKMLV